jgi:ElaB/YqjD/DUF883 family membrane-anchored ribosome-binding protein
MTNEARDTSGRLLDAQGRAMNQTRQAAGQAQRAAGDTMEQMGDYVRHQPVSAALIALGIGYIIGRLRIL